MSEMDIRELYTVQECTCLGCGGSGERRWLHFFTRNCDVCNGAGTYPQLVPTQKCLEIRAATAFARSAFGL